MKKLFGLFLKVGTYALCLAASLILAYNLKFAFVVPEDLQKVLWCNVIWLVSVKIIILILLGEFKGIFSYFRLPDLVKIVTCFTVFSFTLLVLRLCVNSIWLPSREIILSDLLFSILFILFFRTSLRIINGRIELRHEGVLPNSLKVAIIGTDEYCSQIVSEVKAKRVYGVIPVAILDDNPKYFGRRMHNVPVLGTPELLRDLAYKKSINGVIFIRSVLPQKRLLELVELAKSMDLKTLIIPSLGDFLEGRAFASRLRPLDVEDFLEREPIHLNLEESVKAIEGKVICVTGAGGSIGSELSLQIAQKNPKQLILIDHSEYNLFKIEQSLLSSGLSCVPVLLNVANAEVLKSVLDKYRPDVIFHAAAYKHVPLLESQPLIAVKNNVLSTGWLAQYASEIGVKKFVLISTDKAINPVNNMGATKRICEMLCMAMQHRPGNQTQFMAVRFGNVLGSAGSVLPTFREQIARGGPVTVTHPQMTRFFMTIPEAVSLILEAFSFDDIAGKTFVLDMGKPVKILDVAKRMIELNNLRVGIDVEIVYTGIRPGEKLHEDLVFDPQQILPTEHKMIGVFKDDQAYLKHMRPVTDYLAEAEHLTTNEGSIDFIRELIPNFKSS